MSYIACDVSFFCENYDPDRPSLFDPQLGDAVSAYALERGAIEGFCNVAGTGVTFTVSDERLREGVISSIGGASSRHRQIACGLSIALFDNPLMGLPVTIGAINDRQLRLFLTETRTPLHHAIKARMPPALLVTSEYFGADYRSGDIVDGVRHEDLQQTSFPDACFDLIITSDVMEHVPDALAAEREILRILKPGGHYCFTAPLDPVGSQDTVLARLDGDGEIEYLTEPVYHSDPMRLEGALAFRIFSLREMTARFESLGAKCVTYRLWSKSFGLLARDCFVHVVRKTATFSVRP